MGIISGVWFSEQQAIRAEERASDDQREKEIAYFNFYIWVKLIYSATLRSGDSTTP